MPPKLSDNVLAVSIVGGLWFIIISALVMIGIRITALVQWIMTGIEMLILVISGIVAIIKFGIHPLNPFSWSWFSPTDFPSTSIFISGALIATFYYWGWDVSANLNEETKESKRIPGLGALVGILFIFAFFELFTVAIQMGMSQKEIASASSNILQHMGVLLYGPTWGSIMVLAVSLSTIATLETSLLQITRTLFAMGRDGVISEKFGKIHPKWQTPYVSSIVITIVALLFFVLSNFLPSVNKVLTDAINAIGLQVIFYYGLTCLSVIVYYRRVLFKSVSNFVFLFLLPFIAAIFLLAVGIYDIPNLGRETVSIGIGLIVVGIIPLLWGRYKRASFFYQPRETFQPVQSSPDNRRIVNKSLCNYPVV